MPQNCPQQTHPAAPAGLVQSISNTFIEKEWRGKRPCSPSRVEPDDRTRRNSNHSYAPHTGPRNEAISQKQAKRRRREERAKSQRQAPGRTGSATDKGENEIGDLEELLKSGDIDDYAQACWSLANRMEGSAQGPCRAQPGPAAASLPGAQGAGGGRVRHLAL